MGQKLYLECYSGISGDMTVAALSGLMKDRTPLFCVLDHMPVEGFSYELKQVKKSGIDAWDFLVKLDAEHENHDHDMKYLHGHSHTHDHDHHHGHEHHQDHAETAGHHHDPVQTEAMHAQEETGHEEHHHHHHHADEVFTSWGVETAKKFDKAAIEAALHELDSGKYGTILRAKGILPAVDGTWIHFDYVPEECNVRTGSADITGKLCVIGSKLDEAGVAALFGV